MSRKITQQQSEELFEICRNYGVFHYDVQMEFVDHLATSVEEIWESNPEMEYRAAQRIAIQKFGKGNFTKAYRQREKELRKQYNRLLWNHVLAFYRWPKVVMTFVFTLALFLLFQAIEQTMWLLLGYTLIAVIGIILYHFAVLPKFKIDTVASRQFLLLDHMKHVSHIYVFIFQLPNLCFQSFRMAKVESVENSWVLLLISFLMVFFSVILYASLFYIPQRMREHFLETYPDFVKQ